MDVFVKMMINAYHQFVAQAIYVQKCIVVVQAFLIIRVVIALIHLNAHQIIANQIYVK